MPVLIKSSMGECWTETSLFLPDESKRLSNLISAEGVIDISSYLLTEAFSIKEASYVELKECGLTKGSNYSTTHTLTTEDSEIVVILKDGYWLPMKEYIFLREALKHGKYIAWGYHSITTPVNKEYTMWIEALSN